MTPPGLMLAPAPGPDHGPGTGANNRAAHLFAPDSAFARARDGYWTTNDGQHVAASSFDPHAYDAWLDHIWPAAGCSHPIRLGGQIYRVDPATGEVTSTLPTSGLPDGIIYKACGNRRTSACPSCAETYRRDAFQLIRAGLVGGKGVPDHVATHPAVFATFTAPSFGPVHSRSVRLHSCADKSTCSCKSQPCHARRDAEVCPHGRTLACFARHHRDDPLLGQPLCPDCYDHAGHVVWNNTAGELWRRTKQAIERHLNQLARHRHLPYGVRVSHGKAAEYQARGAVHFHVLLRLDGLDDDTPAASCRRPPASPPPTSRTPPATPPPPSPT